MRRCGLLLQRLNSVVRIAAIILEDADIEEAARVIVFSRFVAMSCNNIKRVFAVRGAFNKLSWEIERLIPGLEPHEPSEKFSERDVERCNDFLSECREHSGVALQVSVFYGTQFTNVLKPAVVTIRNPEETGRLKILHEETFVPILPIVRCESIEEAVKRANDSEFGLGASIFTKDKKKFEILAQMLECGGVYHNDAMTEFAIPGVPFGGWKNSGSGYTHGPEGLLEFVRLKTVITEAWKPPKFLDKLHLFPWTETKMKWLKRFLKSIIRLS